MVDFKMPLLYILLFTIITYVYGSIERVDPLVETNVGLIRGLRASDGDYSMFLGIPYAKVNETNPFGVSVPVTSFDDIFEADQESIVCPQVNNKDEIVGGLDCLRLNIYVPIVASSRNQVPVLVFIHGGFFMFGDGSRYYYGPKYLIKQNVIVVTFNYRLGPYGYMCVDTPEVPGNQGMKDQLTAIKWVKNNIQSFGGDINKITLFGESAGGHSIDLHLLSLHDNLFNNVIIQSGSSLAATVFEETPKDAPIILADQLGYITGNINEALSFLASADPHMVLAATKVTNIVFKPCAEKEFENVEPFITSPWINAPTPKVKGMSILIGFNSKERLVEYVDKTPEEFEKLHIFRQLLSQTFSFSDEDLEELEETVRHFYIGDNKISEELKEAIGAFDSDYTYIHPIQRSIRKYIDSAVKDVYYYMFSYRGGRNFMQYNRNITIDGAVHADELGYLFDPITMTEVPSPEDQRIIDQMTTMWANFAKYGDPTPEVSELLPVKWAPLTENNYYYLNIDTDLALKSRPFNGRMAFWDLFYNMNEKLQKGYTDDD